MLPPIWDEVAINMLKTMHMDGASAGIISNALISKGYNFSRNAVIGKKHRMGLPPPPPEVRHKILSVNQAAKPLTNRGSAKIFTFRRPKHMEGKIMEMPASPGQNAVPLLESRDGQCKAIIGYENGELSKAIYCGDPTTETYYKGQLVTGSWCAHHHDIYTQPDRKYR